MNDEEAIRFAEKHVATWNTHDLDAIALLYAESAELVSPLAAALTGAPVVRGRAALRAYFARGLEKYPDLRFELVDTFRCVSSVSLLFRGAGGRLVTEVLHLDEHGKIERVYAHYRCAAG
jgi:hypothetical protein